MIIIAGTLTVAAADREAYLFAVRDVAASARNAPGCLDFVQVADPIEPNRINIYERWESDEDLLAYRQSGGGDDPGIEMPQIVSADVVKYRISAVEAP